MKFRYMSSLLYQAFQKAGYGKWYKKVWNPLNYAIIGGIGFLINTLILISSFTVIGIIPANVLAVLTAWLWNWSMSVGPFGYLWGFKEK